MEALIVMVIEARENQALLQNVRLGYYEIRMIVDSLGVVVHS